MKNIVFRPVSIDAEKYVTKPLPTKKYIPEWFKDTPRFENNEFKIIGHKANTTFKACMPFLDTFTTGYIQETHSDVYIDATEENYVAYEYSSGPPVILDRKTKNYYPRIEGFVGVELAWQQYWIPQMPNGYSMIYTHPLNRFELPFMSLTGIIDNDKFYMEIHANHPFYVRDKFKGIIPKGTPIYQMIPMKRDSWKSKFGFWDRDLQVKFTDIRKVFLDGYKKLYWQKKDFN